MLEGAEKKLQRAEIGPNPAVRFTRMRAFVCKRILATSTGEWEKRSNCRNDRLERQSQ